MPVIFAISYLDIHVYYSYIKHQRVYTYNIIYKYMVTGYYIPI